MQVLTAKFVLLKLTLCLSYPAEPEHGKYTVVGFLVCAGGYEDEFKPLIYKEIELAMPEDESSTKDNEETVSSSNATDTPMEAEDAVAAKSEDGDNEEKEEKMDAEDASAEAKSTSTEDAATEQADNTEVKEDGDAATGATESPSEATPEEEEEKAKRPYRDEKSSPERKRAKKPHIVQFYFNRQHSPYFVCRLDSNMKFFSSPTKVFASLVRCMLDESQLLLARAAELQKQLRLGTCLGV